MNNTVTVVVMVQSEALCPSQHAQTVQTASRTLTTTILGLLWCDKPLFIDGFHSTFSLWQLVRITLPYCLLIASQFLW